LVLETLFVGRKPMTRGHSFHSSGGGPTCCRRRSKKRE